MLIARRRGGMVAQGLETLQIQFVSVTSGTYVFHDLKQHTYLHS